MTNKIYQVTLSSSTLSIIERYGSLEKAPKTKFKNYKKLIDLIKKKKVILSPLFPGTSDSEMKKYFSLVFDEKILNEVIDVLSEDNIFESYYMKPSEDIPI